jgi:hypothetical protein
MVDTRRSERRAGTDRRLVGRGSSNLPLVTDELKVTSAEWRDSANLIVDL